MQRQHLRFADRFIPRLPVDEDPRQFWDLGNPPAIDFLFSFDLVHDLIIPRGWPKKAPAAFLRLVGEFTSNKTGGSRRQNRPESMQHFLKAFARAAWARIVAAEFFDEFFIAMHDPHATLDAGLGGITSAAFTCALESRVDRNRCDAWDTSKLNSVMPAQYIRISRRANWRFGDISPVTAPNMM
jgi:hypothetical protein